MKRLTRSSRERVIAGVCGGVAEFFGLDVYMTRLLWILFAFMGGISIPLYLVLWWALPLDAAVVWESGGVIDVENPQEQARRRSLLGTALIVLGVFFLIDEFFPWFSLLKLWPLLIVAAGVFLIYQKH